MKAYSFYDQVANDYNCPVNQKFYSHVAQTMLDMLPQHLSVKNVLEVGSGTGFTTQILRNRFSDANISALEPSFRMISEAKKKNLDVNWLPLTFAEFVNENKYDLVVSSMAAHWFSLYEWQKFLALNQKAIMALALPFLNRDEDTPANSVLRHLLFKLKPDIMWPKHVRNFKLLLSNLQRNAQRIEVNDFSYTEEFSSSEELVNNLFHRGVFLALFGAEANIAKDEYIANYHLQPTTYQFSWSFKLIISYPRVP